MRAQTLRLLDGKPIRVDGDEMVLALAAPATPEQIRALEAGLRGPIPAQVREALG